MDDGVLLEMRTVAEEADKDVLCGDMEVETARHGETDQPCSQISLQFPDVLSGKEMRGEGKGGKTHTDAISNLLHCRPSGPQGWIADPFSAPLVYHQCESEVRSLNDRHRNIYRFVVVPRIRHLTDHRQERTGARTGDKDRTRSRHSNDESGVRNDVVPEIKVAGLRRGGGTVGCGDAYDDDKNCDVDGYEACPSPRSSSVTEN